jgi:hypothetical protein
MSGHSETPSNANVQLMDELLRATETWCRASNDNDQLAANLRIANALLLLEIEDKGSLAMAAA